MHLGASQPEASSLQQLKAPGAQWRKNEFSHLSGSCPRPLPELMCTGLSKRDQYWSFWAISNVTYYLRATLGEVAHQPRATLGEGGEEGKGGRRSIGERRQDQNASMFTPQTCHLNGTPSLELLLSSDIKEVLIQQTDSTPRRGPRALRHTIRFKHLTEVRVFLLSLFTL